MGVEITVRIKVRGEIKVPVGAEITVWDWIKVWGAIEIKVSVGVEIKVWNRIGVQGGIKVQSEVTVVNSIINTDAIVDITSSVPN